MIVAKPKNIEEILSNYKEVLVSPKLNGMGFYAKNGLMYSKHNKPIIKFDFPKIKDIVYGELIISGHNFKQIENKYNSRLRAVIGIVNSKNLNYINLVDIITFNKKVKGFKQVPFKKMINPSIEKIKNIYIKWSSTLDYHLDGIVIYLPNGKVIAWKLKNEF